MQSIIELKSDTRNRDPLWKIDYVLLPYGSRCTNAFSERNYQVNKQAPTADTTKGFCFNFNIEHELFVLKLLSDT